MKVICAGLPKTGTKSMASALRILGYSVHDQPEQLAIHLEEYLDALEGKAKPDYAAMYADVNAFADTPAVLFWEDILETFPHSKVVLMVRDNEEVWLKSLLKTEELWNATLSSFWMVLYLFLTPTGRKYRRCTDIWPKILPAKKEVYIKHNARVKALIPRDKLLVFNVKQGWKPLCEFLGLEVPDVPFPRLNVKSAGIPDMVLKSGAVDKMFKEFVFIQIVVVIALGILVLFLLG